MDIRLVNLTKIFADKNSEVRAVDNLDITIPSGKLIGLLVHQDVVNQQHCI